MPKKMLLSIRVTVFLVSLVAVASAQQNSREITEKTVGGTKTPEGGPAVNDYIACVFTPDQLSTFRLQPPMRILSPEKAAKVLQAATTTVDALETKGTLSRDLASKLTKDLQAINLVGMDPKEVQAAIGKTLAEATKNVSPSEKQNTASAVKSATNAVVETSFGAPSDVACSLSPLTYKETDQIFGLAIAKSYVAYQVVARNLNPEKEFQLQSVELAVDTDPCGTEEQFDAGRDRLLVRAVAIRNQSTDPRNFAVRIMEGITTIAGAAVGFASSDYANGLAVFSALVPAGKAIFPDYTVDQLNRISDLTFSSSTQTRTVVPKNGVAMFMTFIPSKPLEQAWWIKQATQTRGGSETKACESAKNARTTSSKGWGEGNPKPVAYKNWSPDALLEFRRHSFVIVAGVHTTGDDALIPTIDALSCQDGAKVLNLGRDKAKDEAPTTISCIITGKNLEKVLSLELQNAKDAADTQVAEAPVTVKQGDPTSATAVFQANDLRALNGTTYNVLWTNGQKLSKATEQIVRVQPYPMVTSLDKDSLQLPVINDGTLTVQGSHLKASDGIKPVSEVDLTSADGKNTIALKVDRNRTLDTEMTLSYTASSFKNKPAGVYMLKVFVDGEVVKGASSASIKLSPATQ